MINPCWPVRPPIGLLAMLALVLAMAGCGRDNDRGATPTPATPAADAAAAPPASSASVPTRPTAPPGNIGVALVGTWRQICQPFLPGDGASDITYTITLKGANGLQLAGVAKDYKNTTCAGGGTVIATPVFAQKIVGEATVDGIAVVRLVDEEAGASASADSKSIAGIDQGRLRFGAATGARDSAGFPSTLEKPTDAYNKQ
ncbi:hypothetical protein [Rhodoferax sp.]|uniref:hypothetical protein n=1 Tax=Rhodoferax sp. TaxID=50421 RepID=UPI0027582774|nr:hypothetical protein [Rhodoferax sp.]